MAAAGGAATSTSAADAMDVEDEDGSGVEESKGDELDAAGTTEQEASATGGAAATAGDVPSASAGGSDHMEEEGEDEDEEKDEEKDDEGDTAGEGAGGASAGGEEGGGSGDGAGSGMVCPPGMDPDVFAQLPPEMQQEVIREHRSTMGAMVRGITDRVALTRAVRFCFCVSFSLSLDREIGRHFYLC